MLLSELISSLENSLKDLINYNLADIKGNPESKIGAKISGISFDSRTVNPDNIFFAISGYKEDGSKFILDAIEKGANSVVLDHKTKLDSSLLNKIQIPLVYVSNVRKALSEISSKFYNSPSNSLHCVGITGTNGKTSTAWIVAQLLSAIKPSSYLGTLGVYDFNELEPKKLSDMGRTTLDPLSFQKALSEALDKSVGYAVAEVTSHGLEQFRTSGTNWDVTAFSNLTQDHLDQHGTMEEYANIKSQLFFRELRESNKALKSAVINIDDPYGYEIANKLQTTFPEISLIRVSEKTINSELYLKKILQGPQSTEFTFCYKDKDYTAKMNFIGSFYISNMLLSIGIALASGMSIADIISKIPKIKSVPGRLQLVSQHYPRVFVDYAHTPDALEKVQDVLLEFLSEEAKRTNSVRGRLISVFGCGGDRDKTKRPLMGQAVGKLSDFAIITSDNPRTESPEQIIDDIIPGINFYRTKRDFEYVVIPDRKEAIISALKKAEKNDVILLAGKGHEDYQEINGEKYPFDDVEVVKSLIAKMI